MPPAQLISRTVIYNKVDIPLAVPIIYFSSTILGFPFIFMAVSKIAFSYENCSINYAVTQTTATYGKSQTCLFKGNQNFWFFFKVFFHYSELLALL